MGASWRHYAGRHVQTVTLSHNYLNNRNLKYLRNDDSSEDNLTLRLRSVEQKTTLRAENRTYLGRWTVREGVEVNYSDYTNRTLQRLFTDEAALLGLPDPAGNRRLGAVRRGRIRLGRQAVHRLGGPARRRVRLLGTYGAGVAPLPPRASVSIPVGPGWSVSGSAGLYCQLPPYTALIQTGRGAGRRGARLHARRGLQRGCRLAAARPADRLGRGILQTLRRCAAVGGGRDSALVQGQRLRRGGQREAGLLGAGARLRRRGDGPLADSGASERRGIGDRVPLGVPQRPAGPVDRLGVGQPFRGQRQRNLRPAAPLELRCEV